MQRLAFSEEAMWLYTSQNVEYNRDTFVVFAPDEETKRVAIPHQTHRDRRSVL